MRSTRPSTRSSLAHRFVVWLLVGLAPMQGMAAGMLAVIGPLHVHRVLAEVLVLEDVRRVSTVAPPREVHVATAFGHFHGATPQRHLHGRGDASVLVVAGDAAQQMGDADEQGTSPTLGIFVALLPSPQPWLPDAPRAMRPSRASWSPQTHSPEPLERPPRVA